MAHFSSDLNAAEEQQRILFQTLSSQFESAAPSCLSHDALHNCIICEIKHVQKKHKDKAYFPNAPWPNIHKIVGFFRFQICRGWT